MAKLYKEHIIIDGYNVIHQHAELCDALKRFGWASASDRLINMCLSMIREDVRITIVFDGNGERTDINKNFGMKNFCVIFSSGSFSADAIIEKIILNTKRPTICTVVTNDVSILRSVFSNMANILRANDFFNRVSESRDVLTKYSDNPYGKSKWKLNRAFDSL